MNETGREKFYYDLGCVFDVASRVGKYAKVGLVNLKLWVVPAIELDQIKIFYDERGAPTAYVTWAFVSDRSLRMLELGEVFYLNIHEWLGGEHFWITDLVAPPGTGLQVLRFIRDEILREVGVVAYRRVRSSGHVLSKKIHRRRCQ